jgi:hypothetical protein
LIVYKRIVVKIIDVLYKIQQQISIIEAILSEYNEKWRSLPSLLKTVM